MATFRLTAQYEVKSKMLQQEDLEPAINSAVTLLSFLYIAQI